MRPNAKISPSARFIVLLLAVALAPLRAFALHEESPPATRLTSGADHAHPRGRSWGNWFAFSSTQDLANLGAARTPGRQIFVFNMAYFDCAQGTTLPTTPCPLAGTPFLVQITNGIGDPDNPSMGTPPSNGPQDVWVAFDALGSFNGNNAPASTFRQIFMKNLRTNELRQVTVGTNGDSVSPSVNRIGGVAVFQSTASLGGGFLNPAGVPQVFLFERASGLLRQISIGNGPAHIVGQGPSLNPVTNENGTAVTFESTSAFFGNGADTGVSQIFFATYDKRTNESQLYQVTNGNLASHHPFLGEAKKAPGPARNVLQFESTATNLPNTLGTPGSQIYEVDLAEDTGTPTGQIQHITNSTAFGECFFPTTDPSGNRTGFVCTGDPLQNGTTGNRAFTLDRVNLTLFQLTGLGEVQGPIGLNIGQWFMTLATTSDLTQGGSCGFQLYVIDYQFGKWAAATGIGQRPGDAIGQGPNSFIGLRNFEIRAGDAAGGSAVTVVTRDGATTAPINQDGRIGMIIGAPDDIFFEAPVRVPLDHEHVVLPPMPIPGYGTLCLDATEEGLGTLDCNGGLIDSDVSSTQDHLTDDADYFCDDGCREDETSCQATHLPGPYLTECPVCVEASRTCDIGPNTGIACTSDVTCQLGIPCTQCPICDEVTQVCTSGPHAGIPCSADVTCQEGLNCNVVPSCNGPLVREQTGTYVAGGMRITFPVTLRIVRAPGPDEKWCTADDTPTSVVGVEGLLRLTTANSTATIDDTDAQAGLVTTDTTVGAPFDCARVRTGDLTGAAFVGTLQFLNFRLIPGLRDVIYRLRFEPEPDALSSCSPFCTDSAGCDDGNACNGSESCVANRCTPGTALVCDDGLICNGFESCDTAAGCQPGTPPVCDNGNPCDGVETCAEPAGCTPGTPVTCPDPDNDVCTGVPACNPANGACENPGPLNCDDLNVCTDDTCDPVSGCANTDNTLPCDDGTLCTENDICGGGTCAGTPTPAAVTCEAGNGNVCDGAEFCDPATGTCTDGPDLDCDDNNDCTTDTCDAITGCAHTNLTGTACDDGSACTGAGGTDVCTNGVCGGAAVVCEDNDVCNGVATCDPATGCVAGTPLTCDDGNQCTADSCDPINGCANVPLDGNPCDDGNACTGPGGTDVCNDDQCTGAPLPCDDGDVCDGIEGCDPIAGCFEGDPLDCVDGNDCTDDTCDPVSGCSNPPLTGPICDDGDNCTTTDVCTAGTCGGTPVVCENNDLCDGVATCNPTDGSCTAGTPLDCDDTNGCTDDSCDPLTGCVNAPNTNACDDGTVCTTGDVCADGACTGTPLPCNDNNACNGIETCDPVSGCLLGTAPDCNDDDACTADSCDPSIGCVNDIDPNVVLCRLNLLADAILSTPAEDLGGVKKKAKLTRMVSAAVKLYQKSQAANPRQRDRNLRAAQRKLAKLVRILQKYEDAGIVQASVADPLLALARSAAIALQELGS